MKRQKPTREERALLTTDQRTFEAAAEATRAMERRRVACERLARRRPQAVEADGEEEWNEREIL